MQQNDTLSIKKIKKVLKTIKKIIQVFEKKKKKDSFQEILNNTKLLTNTAM